jgi:hypothetical protein
MLARHYIAAVGDNGRDRVARCDLLAAFILVALLATFLLRAQL